MKQTAVEWLINQMVQSTTMKGWIEIFEQAEEMEKQQIIDAWEDGQNSFSTINAKQYYKEIFNNK